MIYTLSSNGSFCDILVSRWLKEYQDGVWGVSKITLIVPTNRSVRTFREAFLRQTGGKTLLLPKIISFANLDVFDQSIPEPISDLERRLILAKLIQKKQPMGEDKAFSLAGSLADLIDEMHNYDVSFDKLKEVVPENFASHWQETLSFLEIINSYWPQILKDMGKIDPSLYQIMQAEALIESWQKVQPQNPIFAVGFSGGLPIVEKFLKAVMNLPLGQIYIPNLDKNLSDDMWDCLDETHPQYYLKKLLAFLNVKRKDVVDFLPLTERFSLLSNALIPAAKTGNWQENLNAKSDNQVRLVECKTPQTEAFEIACLLREVLETPEKTAALVTTDRQLARRVKIQMQKWDVELDDSAGTPLALTPVGTFLIGLANAAVSQKQANLLTVLKHPLCLDGNAYTEFRKKVHEAEKKARARGVPLEIDLHTDLSRFMNLFINPIRIPFEVLLKTHMDVAQSLCASADRTGEERLWGSEAGQVASDLLTDVMANAETIGDIEPTVYADFFKMLMQTMTVRPKYGMHPRLDILGPIEARLQQPDLVILGGLNEGSFPQTPQADNWINRPMRQMCGLPQPEEKIGVSAQDFMHLLQAKEVILTRALKVDGVQTIPSRWLVRLQTVLEKSGQKLTSYGEGFTNCMMKVNAKKAAQRPSPNPPVEVRPKNLSISDICTFLKDPYAIYAKHILKLYKLQDLTETPNESCFGNAVHNAFAAFLRLPQKEQTKERLFLLGEQFLKQEGFADKDMTFPKLKFEKIARWFLKEYQDAFPKAIQYLIEQTAIMELQIKDKTFRIKGRADRIDIFDDKTATIIDYKTGSVIPSATSVESGYEPQLPLEAVMLKEGLFQTKDVTPEKLLYWHVNGGKEGGAIKDVSSKLNMETFLDDIKARLMRLLGEYEDQKTAYPACPKLKYAPVFNDYAHLERLPEWQEEGED